jgi:hypothetical protein
LISEKSFLAKSSRFVVSSRGLTSSITRDMAITSFFTFFFAASFASSATFFAAAADSSSASSSPNKSSKSSSFLALALFTATAPIGKIAFSHTLICPAALTTSANEIKLLYHFVRLATSP